MGWVVDIHKCEIPSEEEVAEHERGSVWECPLCTSRWVIAFGTQKAKLELQRQNRFSLKDAQVGWNSGAAGTPVDFSKIPKPDSTVTGRLSYNEPAFEEIPDPDPVVKWNQPHDPMAYDRDMMEAGFGQTTKYGNEITRDEASDDTTG